MIYLRNKLYIKWKLPNTTVSNNVIRNLNCYIDKINKFKLVVIDFYGKYTDVIKILEKLTPNVVGVKIFGHCISTNDNTPNKKFPNLTNSEIYNKISTDEIIDNEELQSNFICTCNVDSVFIKNSEMFYGICENKKFVCNLEKSIPDVEYSPIYCNKKDCKEQFTKINKKTVSYKKDVCIENPMFYIKWRLLNACNYKCSYCIRKDLDKININYNLLLENAKNLNKMKIPFRLELIGGEVTLLNLKNLISNITTENLKAVYISTNLSKDTEYFIDLYNYLHSRNIELALSCSLHEEECNEDEFIKKIKELSNIVDRIYLECVSTDNNKPTIEKIIKIENIKISIDYLRDRQDNILAKERFYPVNKKVDILSENKFMHHSELSGFVSAGLKCKSNGLYIDVDGSVYGRSCKQKSLISNINDYDFNIKEDIIDCPNSVCNFSSNVEVYNA